MIMCKFGIQEWWRRKVVSKIIRRIVSAFALPKRLSSICLR